MDGIGRPVASDGNAMSYGMARPSMGLGRPGSNGMDFGTGWGKIAGFGKSAFESFPEMFGIEPTQETQAFRAVNPVSGIASQLLGLGGFYAVGTKAVTSVPRLAALVERAPLALGINVAKRPMLAAGVTLGAETAMVEAARLGIAATPVPEAVFGRERTESMGELGVDAAFNIATGGVLGAGFKGIQNMVSKGPRVSDLVGAAHPSQPRVIRARALDEAVNTGKSVDGTVTYTPEQLADLAYQRTQLKRAVIAGIEPAYTPTGHARLSTAEGAMYEWDIGDLVRPLVGDSVPKTGRSTTDALNVLFNPTKRNVNRVGETRLFTVDSAKGFASQSELDSALGKVGLDLDELPLVGQSPRYIKVNTGTGAAPDAGNKAALSIENLLTGKRKASKGVWSRVANDWYLSRETDDGMWIAAKKVEGTVGKPAEGDAWFLMKTDTPSVLDPQAEAFKQVTVNRAAYFPQRTVENIGEDTFDVMNKFRQEFAQVLTLPKNVPLNASALRAAGRDLSEIAASYLAPAIGAVARNRKANYILNVIKTATDFENARVSNIMDGGRSMKAARPVWQQVLGTEQRTDSGLVEFFKTLDEADWADVKDVLEMEIPFEKLQEIVRDGLITPNAFNVLQRLEGISRNNVGAITKLKEHVGAPNAVSLVEDFNARAGHYGLTRERHGGYHAFVDDARTGELAGMVSGNTAKEARDKAIQLITDQSKRGRELSFGGMGNEVYGNPEQMRRLKAAVRKPGFLKARGELLGDELMNGPLDADKFTDLVERNIRRRERFKTNIVLQEQLWDAMVGLKNEDALLHTQMEKRLNILQGDEGEFARATNAVVDKVLGPIMGKDSASKIVQGAQGFLNAFQFGFGNLAHYTLNAISMFQTTFPEAAFLMRTAGRDLANYTTVPIMDDGGRIIDSAHVLSDIKLFRNSLKLVFTNDKDAPADWKLLLQEMVDQGQITARYEGGRIGSTNEVVTNLKGAFENGRSFIKWAGAANEFLLAKSEEFNRLVGVSTAYHLAKALGINDPYRMSRFTREFLSKTAYNYTTVDRPTVFTTPVGSLLGTFKTWMFHYMASMAKYAGGGRETLAPLLWQTAGTAAIGGGVATPLFLPMANAASKWFTDKSFMENIYAGTGMEPGDDRVEDGIMYGLPGLLGLSLASQASSPGSDPARDATMMFNFAIADRMKHLGKATGQAFTAYKATGVSPWEDDQVRDQMARALAPRTLYRAMSLSEDKAIESLNNGYRVMDNVSLGDGLLYSMGFNPVELEKTYAAYNDIRKDQTKKQNLTKELGRQLADAWEDGDTTQATRIFTNAMATGVDQASVLRSAKARQERAESTQLEFVLGKDKTGAGESWRFVVDGANVDDPNIQ